MAGENFVADKFESSASLIAIESVERLARPKEHEMNRPNNTSSKILILIAWLVGILGIAPGQTAFAGTLVSGMTFTVNSALDKPDDLSTIGTCHTAANTCTLRAAIMQANRSGSPTVTIILPAGIYKLTIAPAGTDDEKTGDLNLAPPIVGGTSVIIRGAGAEKTIIDGNQSDRVLFIDTGRTVNILGVTIRNGKIPSSSGGGIYNKGSLTLANSIVTANSAYTGGGIYVDNVMPTGTLAIINSTISANSAGYNGGGIHNMGTMAVTKSTISNNSALFYGGGIISDGDATVTGSTISGNNANYGGGIANDGIALTITNSTLSGNTASTNGGGIWHYSGVARLFNTSILVNFADPDGINGGLGGGIYNYNGASFYVFNSLVAGNYAQYANYGDCNGTITAYSYNLFWDLAGCAINGGGINWGYVNSLSLIGPLQNNGGPTQTRALLPGSNAIDGGDNCADLNGPLVTDQRGVLRFVGAKCDVGAFEYVPPYLSQATQVGWVLESGENSNAGGTLNNTSATLLIGDNMARKQFRGILSFNTSSLPDNAVITKIILKIRKQGIAGGGNPITQFSGFMVDIKKGTFGTSALQITDFQAAASKTYGPFTPALTGGWYRINLTSAGAYINKLGLTQIRLRFSLDDNNDSTANYLSLYSGNAGAASSPQLIIEYHIP